MKSFKTYINERAIDAVKIVDYLERGTIEYIDDQENFIKRDITLEDLYKFIETNFNAKNLGEGSFALVKKGESGEDYILKVVRRPDPAYETYIDVAMRKGKSNSLYPHILYSGELPSQTYNISPKVYLIEYLKLDQMRIHSDSQFSSFRLFRYANLIYRLCNKMIPFDYDYDSIDYLNVHDNLSFLNTEKVYKMKFDQVLEKAGLAETFEKFNVRISELESWLADYNKHFSGNNGSFFLDLHEENLGWRKNGQCVLFDPIAKITH